MLQDFFEHTINKVYQNYRAMIFLAHSPLSIASSYIKFGGWEMSYNWKGRTRTTKEVVGSIEIITKTIHFNYKYALWLMKVDTGKEYDLFHFVRTLAHEIAHCLLLDYNSKYLNQHTESHRKLTDQLELYLWTLPEIKELTNLQLDVN